MKTIIAYSSTAQIGHFNGYYRPFNGFYHPFATVEIKKWFLGNCGTYLPSWVDTPKTHMLIDPKFLNWFTTGSEFGHISNYCVAKWGTKGFVYDSNKVCRALSKLSFLRKVQATPWTAEDNLFFAINNKKLKKWFKQNHNRFLLKLTPDHKRSLADYLTN